MHDHGTRLRRLERVGLVDELQRALGIVGDTKIHPAVVLEMVYHPLLPILVLAYKGADHHLVLVSSTQVLHAFGLQAHLEGSKLHRRPRRRPVAVAFDLMQVEDP